MLHTYSAIICVFDSRQRVIILQYVKVIGITMFSPPSDFIMLKNYMHTCV